jgi:NCAIR mutase (PurE)-related protein
VGNFATLDLGRTARTGLPEVVWGPGKTPQQIVSIMGALRDRQSVVMATRITPEVYEAMRALQPGIEYNPVARVCRVAGTAHGAAHPVTAVHGTVVVLTVGLYKLNAVDLRMLESAW